MNLISLSSANGVETHLPEGRDVLRQGERRNQLWVLVSGSVEIVKNDTQICTVTDQGAVFGEMSALLRSYQTATVRTLEPSVFRVIDGADEFLATHPEAAFNIARILARRLALLDSCFSEMKRQYNDLAFKVEFKEEKDGRK